MLGHAAAPYVPGVNTPRTLSAELAEFLCSVRIDDLPRAVLERLKDDVVDIAGCVTFGYETPWGQAIAGHVADLQEPGTAGLWGSDIRSGPGSAALGLGTLGHSFDFDDYHPGAKLHPATVVCPAAIALGESLHRSGEDVLLAIALGFETMIRLSLATGPVSTMLNGFHLTGVCGSVGAAAAAARLLQLDAPRTAHALGLAATQAAGLMGFLHDGSESKRLHAGKAAQSGILAAQLAQRGFTGPARAFELEHGGFCHAFSPDPSPPAMLDDLGSRWRAGEISFKRYSCCGSIHSTLDLVTDAVRQLDIEADAVDEIEVRHSPAVIAQCGWEYVPADVLHAQMSLQYCIAVLLLEGTVLPAQFRPDLLADPDVLRLAKRIRFTPDADIEARYPARFASRVIVRADGRERDLRTDDPKGAPDHPLSREEVDEKFHRLAETRLGKEQRYRFADGARQLEDWTDVTDLVQELRVSPQRPER